MNYDEFIKFQKAIELYLEDEAEQFTQAIEQHKQKRGISWRLFKDYSIFGEPSETKPDPKMISDVELEELYRLIESRGVTRAEIQEYRGRAEALYKKHGISAMNRGWHHRYDESGSTTKLLRDYQGVKK